MAGSVHHPDVPQVASRRQPIEGDRYRVYERVSDPGIIPGRRKRGIVLGTVLGIAAGLLTVGLLRSGGSSGVTLGDTPVPPARAPAFEVNPGYLSALAIPAGTEASSADEASHSSVAGPTELQPGEVSGESEPRAQGSSSAGASVSEDRENVSGTESPSQDRPIDALGRETHVGVPDLDVGDLDVQGPGTTRREEELKERLDMAPTETAPSQSLPSVGTKPRLPSSGTDNPY